MSEWEEEGEKQAKERMHRFENIEAKERQMEKERKWAKTIRRHEMIENVKQKMKAWIKKKHIENQSHKKYKQSNISRNPLGLSGGFTFKSSAPKKEEHHGLTVSFGSNKKEKRHKGLFG